MLPSLAASSVWYRPYCHPHPPTPRAPAAGWPRAHLVPAARLPALRAWQGRGLRRLQGPPPVHHQVHPSLQPSLLANTPARASCLGFMLSPCLTWRLGLAGLVVPASCWPICALMFRCAPLFPPPSCHRLCQPPCLQPRLPLLHLALQHERPGHCGDVQRAQRPVRLADLRNWGSRALACRALHDTGSCFQAEVAHTVKYTCHICGPLSGRLPSHGPATALASLPHRASSDLEPPPQQTSSTAHVAPCSRLPRVPLTPAENCSLLALPPWSNPWLLAAIAVSGECWPGALLWGVRVGWDRGADVGLKMPG